MRKTEFNDLRTDYGKNRIDEDAVPENPFLWFAQWLDEAVNCGIPDANAMIMSTVSSEGKPSSRVVLLKELSENGMVFFTNYESRKGEDIAVNPNIALLFFWPQLERQIRIEGRAQRITEIESNDYFNSRPLQSRAAAVVSEQSKVIPDRKMLDKAFDELISTDKEITRPQHWGGYRVIPCSFEFWQGRPNRLHDRIRFRLEKDNWIVERLAP